MVSMVSLGELWLPILLSAVVVFVVSSVIHMVVKWHNNDWGSVPNEADVMGAMRSAGVKPGQYFFPNCQDFKDMATPEMQEKYNAGPVGFMTVLPDGVPGMGKSLILWFLYSLLISAIAGYVGTLALSHGAGYGDVFRVVGTAGVLGYAVSCITDSIWKGVSWTATLKFVIDGVLYGLATAGTFAWLWPDAASIL
jgi:hypothetical protein